MPEAIANVGSKGLIKRFWDWLMNDFFGLIKEFRPGYLPPLMVYFAAGISGFTGIVETFFVKEYLDLSPVFLAALAFWAQVPWTLKMPVGHLVDLFWRRKALFVYLGAALMAASMAIMVGLTGYTAQLAAIWPLSAWYVLAALLAPVGYVFQDVVADAMTVEAVPATDADGAPLDEAELRRRHTTMQTLGRVAIIGGSALVAGIGGWLANVFSYATMYKLSLVIPVVSVSGVLLHGWLNRRARQIRAEAEAGEKARPDWRLLGGSALFIALSVALGLSHLEAKEEIIFLVSLAIIIYLMRHLTHGLSRGHKRELIGVAVIIFIFRAMPSAGAGAGWWQIDALHFDAAFFGTLRQISSILAILGMFALYGWMSRRPVPYLIAFLSVFGAAVSLPFIGMYYGLADWTQAVFGFGARTITIVDTMADSPLGQVAMIPLLVWIAREAPPRQKAAYFAVMSAFTNLALSAASLGTKYLNGIFVVERGQYGELGKLFIIVTALGLILPVGAVLVYNALNRRWAGKEKNTGGVPRPRLQEAMN